MEHFTSDPAVLRKLLQVRTLQAVIPALRKLGRAARGREDFVSDFQFRACVELTRLAHFVLRGPEPVEPYNPIHPRYSHIADQLMDEMEAIRAEAKLHPDPADRHPDLSDVSID